MTSLFTYRDYKSYLLDHMGKSSRGERNRLAHALRCHNGYVSQVLKDQAHFSLEQTEQINEFLGHSKEQSHFFLLLVQMGRAGTPTLRKYFRDQIEGLAEKQVVLKNRLQFQKTLSREDQAIFYSSWHYGAVHVLVSVPGCDSELGLRNYLEIPLERIREVLGFLTSIGLLKQRKGLYEIGPNQIHLESDSPMISKHHTNWRMRAIQAMDSHKKENLHYSSVITASAEDSVRIREIMVAAIEEVRAVVRPSPSEAGFAYSLDFFKLKNQ